jgi:hypothetical protein
VRHTITIYRVPAFIEEAGWIFASNGKTSAWVKFIDGGHR